MGKSALLRRDEFCHEFVKERIFGEYATQETVERRVRIMPSPCSFDDKVITHDRVVDKRLYRRRGNSWIQWWEKVNG